MRLFVTSKNVKWCHLIWPTLYSSQHWRTIAYQGNTIQYLSRQYKVNRKSCRWVGKSVSEHVAVIVCQTHKFISSFLICACIAHDLYAPKTRGRSRFGHSSKIRQYSVCFADNNLRCS